MDLRNIIVECGILYNAIFRAHTGHLLESPNQGTYNGPECSSEGGERKGDVTVVVQNGFQNKDVKFSDRLGENQPDEIN
jgi:hypothetical protein